jgi:hypothetical protein
MNTPQLIEAVARPTPYTGKTFAAFKLSDIGANGPKWRTSPIPLDGYFASLDQTRDAALTGRNQPGHKDCLLIRETDDATGATVLHLFAIKKKSTPDYVRDGFTTRAVHRLYAEKICEIDGSALA